MASAGGFIAHPGTVFIALLTTDGEVTGGSYVREPATFKYCADGVEIANLATIVWPRATADWGTITQVQIWDAASGGTLLCTAPLLNGPLAVPMYARARIPAAGCVVVRIPLARPYGTLTFGTYRWGTLDGLSTAGGAGFPYGVGPYGVGPYGGPPRGVLLELTFDTSEHVCGPGTWAVYQEAA